MCAGVCGGIADYLEVDPTLVRLVFVALTLLSSGSGLVIYLVLMLVVPEEPREKRKNEYEAPVSDVVREDNIPVPPSPLDWDTPSEEAVE